MSSICDIDSKYVTQLGDWRIMSSSVFRSCIGSQRKRDTQNDHSYFKIFIGNQAIQSNIHMFLFLAIHVSVFEEVGAALLLLSER